MTLQPEEFERYSRHLALPEVGVQGQIKLKLGKVVVVGAGGLGAPVGLYLAAAGVGTLGFVDFDDVDGSNLQRQVLFGTQDIGKPKLDATKRRLSELNPNIQINTHPKRLSPANALDILGNYDIVVDGTDNFVARYLINDACVLLGKPNVHGSVLRFQGHVSVLGFENGPCYRCLFPEPPPPGSVPDCAEGGVLGVLPGMVGTMQANETLKILLGIGSVLSGRLLVVDALDMTFRQIGFERNRDCAVCGISPVITSLSDDVSCQGDHARVRAIPELTPDNVKSSIDSGETPLMLDVRLPHEREICHLGGQLIPLAELPARLHELDRNVKIVAYCKTGIRSAAAVEFLQRQGFRKVWNLRGGIHAWSVAVDPTLPKY